ncbi:MAG: hypothetical protein Q8O43_09325 [Dehalococcoidia bacterium]|nr:hypothetical protein [Dehalococcoidia bacterium]
MGIDDMVLESGQRWAINLDWLKAHDRSLTTMATGALCPRCRRKLKTDRGEAKTSDLFKSAKSCCSKTPDYITPGLPLQESAFRVMLANGNQPLTLEELGNQLNDRRGIDVYRTSPVVLSRLMRNDRHYGFQPVGV